MSMWSLRPMTRRSWSPVTITAAPAATAVASTTPLTTSSGVSRRTPHGRDSHANAELSSLGPDLDAASTKVSPRERAA